MLAVASVVVLGCVLLLDQGGRCDGVSDTCAGEPLGDWGLATFWIVVTSAFVVFCVARTFGGRRD